MMINSASLPSHRAALSANPEKYGESFKDCRRHWLSPTLAEREIERERGQPLLHEQSDGVYTVYTWLTSSFQSRMIFISLSAESE